MGVPQPYLDRVRKPAAQLWPPLHGLTNPCSRVVMEARAACWGTLRVVATAWTAGCLGRLGVHGGGSFLQ